VTCCSGCTHSSVSCNSSSAVDSSFVLLVAAPEAPGPSGGSEPSMSWSCGGSEDPTEHDRTEFTDDWWWVRTDLDNDCVPTESDTKNARKRNTKTESQSYPILLLISLPSYSDLIFPKIERFDVRFGCKTHAWFWKRLKHILWKKQKTRVRFCKTGCIKMYQPRTSLLFVQVIDFWICNQHRHP